MFHILVNNCRGGNKTTIFVVSVNYLKAIMFFNKNGLTIPLNIQ